MSTVVDGVEAQPTVFRRRLRELYLQARRPTYRTLEAHADRDGGRCADRGTLRPRRQLTS